MKTYTVTIKGEQSHIQGQSFENRTAEQVNEIISQYIESDIEDEYGTPTMDGQWCPLTSDQNVCIEEEKYIVYVTSTEGAEYVAFRDQLNSDIEYATVFTKSDADQVIGRLKSKGWHASFKIVEAE